MQNNLQAKMENMIIQQEEAVRIFAGKEEKEEDKREHFRANYMKSGATSDQYLESILQDVPLQKIREIVRSCHFDQNNLFCAVLSKVSDPRLKDKYGDGSTKCNYLFEVWSQGELLFQRPLKNKIRVWNTSRQNNSIIYVLHPEDEELDEGGKSYIHIVSLNKACSMTNVVHNKDELMEQ